jgi:hypothetical protein
MLVLGDFAYPDPDLTVESRIFQGETVLVNCEGYIQDNSGGKASADYGVYNNPIALRAFKCLNVIIGLANNHVMDSPSGVADSIKIAEDFGFSTVGAGRTFEEAIEPLVFTQDGVEIAVVAGGWDAIGCVHSTATSQGCAPLLDSVLLPTIRAQKSLGRKVLVFVHWGYELEIYPHPTHRNCALGYIDNGADIVVGCHAHCLQGHELYKDKHIFYGLGNAVFKQGRYFKGRIRFPPSCDSGLMVKWTPGTNVVRVADIALRGSVVSVSEFFDPVDHAALSELSAFSGCSQEQYLMYFSGHRRKRRLLPIFKESDVSVAYKTKILFVRARANLISALLKAGLKKHSR